MEQCDARKDAPWHNLRIMISNFRILSTIENLLRIDGSWF